MDKKEFTFRTVATLSILVTAFFLLAFLFSGCCTQKETVTGSSRTDRFTGSEKTTRDSIYFYLSDSIYIREKGDTVYIDRRHTEYRDRIRVDTVAVRDSVYVDREISAVKVVEVNRLTGRQSLQILTGRIFAGIVCLFIIYKLIKRRLSV
jgi:hypothetical protein